MKILIAVALLALTTGCYEITVFEDGSGVFRVDKINGQFCLWDEEELIWRCSSKDSEVYSHEE